MERLHPTRVVYRYQLQARPRWLQPALNPLLRFIFSRETRRRLAALKRYVEAS